MNTPNELPYCVPATDGKELNVFVVLPTFYPNGSDVQSVPLTLAQARALAVELIEAAQHAQDQWGA